MRVRPAGIAVVSAVVIAWLAVASALQAQMPAPTHFVSWRPDALGATVQLSALDTTSAKGSASGMLLGGIGGTLIGWLTGALVGGALADDQGGDGAWDGAYYGAMVGATVGVPVGIHYGNHGQGSLVDDLLVSVGIGAVGIVVSSAVQNGIPILLTPLAQIIATIAMEDHAVRKAALRDASQ